MKILTALALLLALVSSVVSVHVLLVNEELRDRVEELEDEAARSQAEEPRGEVVRRELDRALPELERRLTRRILEEAAREVEVTAAHIEEQREGHGSCSSWHTKPSWRRSRSSPRAVHS